MNRVGTRTLRAMALAGLPAGCATVNPTADYQAAAAAVEAATARRDLFRPGDEAVAAERVDELLSEGVTSDEAVQVALLNNRELQAACFEIGMARADLVQSGLLSNPSLAVAVKFPSGGGLAMLESSIAQNIADLWQIPPRKRAAEHQLDRAILATCLT